MISQRSPFDLDDVHTQAQVWIQKSRQVSREDGPNWFSVIPLCAWVRHLARVSRTRSLFNTISALFSIYQEAFIQAEMSSQGLSAVTGARSSKTEEGRFGPTRFMYEFTGMLEYVYRYFGPGCMIEPVENFCQELANSTLIDTPWHMSVLTFFSVITDRDIPAAKEYLTETRDMVDLHPGKWPTQRLV